VDNFAKIRWLKVAKSTFLKIEEVITSFSTNGFGNSMNKFNAKQAFAFCIQRWYFLKISILVEQLQMQ